MDFEGFIKDIQIDWKTGQPNIVLQCDSVRLADFESYINKRLCISLDIFKPKRSRDANAYAWVLMTKIGKATMTDKWDVYLQALKRYSTSFVTAEVDEKALPMLTREWRAVDDLGVCGNGKHTVHLYFGSHTFNSSEMATFIDGLISEAQNLEIETLRPIEIERLKQLWESSHPSSQKT